MDEKDFQDLLCAGVEQKRQAFPHRAVIAKWVKTALKEGQPWIRSGTNGSILIVEPRAAINWFLNSPTRCGLIPKELADMVAPSTVDAAPVLVQLSSAPETEQAPPRAEQAPVIKSRKRPKRGGRPPAVNWEMVEQEVFRLMEENGEFSVDDPDWNAQARLEEGIGDFCQNKFCKRPSEATIRGRIRKPLERWRKQRTET
jgi:hypothetical protein